MTTAVTFNGQVQTPVVMHLGTHSALVEASTPATGVILTVNDDAEIHLSQPGYVQNVDVYDVLDEVETDDWGEIADRVLYQM